MLNIYKGVGADRRIGKRIEDTVNLISNSGSAVINRLNASVSAKELSTGLSTTGIGVWKSFVKLYTECFFYSFSFLISCVNNCLIGSS